MRCFLVSAAIAVTATLPWRLQVHDTPESRPAENDAKPQCVAMELVHEKLIPSGILLWTRKSRKPPPSLESCWSDTFPCNHCLHRTPGDHPSPHCRQGRHAKFSNDVHQAPARRHGGGRSGIESFRIAGCGLEKVTVITDRGGRVLELRAKLPGQPCLRSPRLRRV